MLTIRVRSRLDRVQQLHRRDVVYIDLRFEHDDQSFPVHFHRKHRRREDELAYRRLSLRISCLPSKAPPAHLGVDDLQLPRRIVRLSVCSPNEGDERRAEQHLDDARCPLVGYE